MASSTHQLPHLVKTEWSKQLVVKGKPFLMRAGELQNSSLTSASYMNTVWQKMADMNVNTLLGCVTWETTEPVEGSFDFRELDKVILDARKHDMHLILLWFGSFKNGVSTYAPGWVKTDPERFPRAKIRKAGGILETTDTLSLFHPESEASTADAKAFGKLMEHLREIDESDSTVIMVQVENEIGLLGDSRDASDLANIAFKQPVPHDVVEFLESDRENLHESLVEHHLGHFQGSNAPKGGDWEAMFGVGAKTDELFMAYHYARYLNKVAAAGKAVYNIPFYTNVWVSHMGEDIENNFPLIVGGGHIPGQYPSGGGCINVLDIWMHAAPNLDFISPDCYLYDYSNTCAQYRHRNQPLFVPEQRRDAYGARRIWIALGSYAALGTGPFGIDTLEPETSAFTKHYGLLKDTSALVLEAQRRPDVSIGFCFDELPDGPNPRDPNPVVRHIWDGIEISIERCFVFGKPGTGAGMVIHRGGGKFLLIGWGFQVRAKALAKDRFTGILSFEEKFVVDADTGELETGRILNGDETRGGVAAMMPNEDPDYGGFPICVTIPARSMIAEVEFYTIKA